MHGRAGFYYLFSPHLEIIAAHRDRLSTAHDERRWGRSVFSATKAWHVENPGHEANRSGGRIVNIGLRTSIDVAITSTV